jgi:hypothetical protein
VLGLKPLLTPSVHPYQKLLDCLGADSGKLRPMTTENLRAVTARLTGQMVDKFAGEHYFIKLAEPKNQRNGQSVPNEFYLRPDKLVAAMNQGSAPAFKNVSMIMPEAFVQSLTCQRQTVDGEEQDFEHASSEARKKMFRNAVREAREAQQAILEAQFTHCGASCRELVADGLSKNTQENFADWLAHKTLPRFLNREASVEKRREMVGLAGAVLCRRPASIESSSEFQEEEKSFSFEPHPDNRIRRVSVFNREVRQSLACQPDRESQKGFGECGL